MAFDFPATPTTGTIYSPAGGPSYRWDGDKWQLVSTQYRLKTAEPHNYLINPVFNYLQGLTGPYATGYIGDNFAFYRVLSTGVVSSQSRIAKVSPRGSRYRLRSIVTTPQAAMSAAQFALIETYIEGFELNPLAWGLAQGKPAVLTFGWNGPAGTYCVAVSNSPITRTFLAAFTVLPGEANTDVYFSIPISPPPSGTFRTDIGIGVSIDFGLACGSDYLGSAGWSTGEFIGITGLQANGLAAANTFELFDTGFFADPDNTGLPPVWDPPNEIDDLRRCKRFYETAIPSGFSGNVTSGQSYTAFGRFEVAKSGNPTLSGTNGANTSFGATVGTLANLGDFRTFSEARAATATATGLFRTLITGNARF
jgi:hypothetical protein